MKVLGIETSCDETAVAVVEDGRVLCNLIASQVDLHARFGGVVPELAGRAHVEALAPLTDAALEAAGCRFADLEGVAVTVGPGLIGALLVGIAAAKGVAFATGAPLIGVNHLEGHIYANFLEHGGPGGSSSERERASGSPPEGDEGDGLLLPAVCLVVSGGHTMLVHMPAEHEYRVLGQTVDDAAGEAFDKIARFLGLGFPGGPALDRLAADGDPGAYDFPRAMADSGDLDFSLSGLKTAVLRRVKQERAAGREPDLSDVAASFQESIVDVQVTKTMRAAQECGVSVVLLGGGVVANTRLRERMSAAGADRGIRVVYPSIPLCTDNGAMIARAGWSRLVRGERTPFDVGADAALELAG